MKKLLILNCLFLCLGCYSVVTALPPPPPPPPAPGLQKAKAVQDLADTMKEINKLFAEYKDTNSLTLAGNLLTMYLSGNKELVATGIKTGEQVKIDLDTKLTKEIQTLSSIKNSNELITNYIQILKDVQTNLNQLTTKTYRSAEHSSKIFSEAKEHIEDLCSQYFTLASKSEDELSKSSEYSKILSSLLNVENILDKTIVLANSFADLSMLVEQPSVQNFNEVQFKQTLAIVRLRSAIKNKLLTSPSTNLFLPDNETISESESLKTALSYIDEAINPSEQELDNSNQLQPFDHLLAMRDIIANPYSNVIQNPQTDDNMDDPWKLILALPDDINSLVPLLRQAYSLKTTTNYSQLGKMITETSAKYGGSLISSVYKILSTSLKTPDIQISPVLTVLRNKEFKGNVAQTYITLLNSYRNFSYSLVQGIVGQLQNQIKFKAKFYKRKKVQKETAAKNEDLPILRVTYTDKDGVNSILGTKKDPNNLVNSVVFSVLNKKFQEYISSIETLARNIKKIPEWHEKLTSFPNTHTSQATLVQYINNVIKSHIDSNVSGTENTDEYSLTFDINNQTGILTEQDANKLILLIAQHCNLFVNTNKLAYPTLKSKDNHWIYDSSKQLKIALQQCIDAINTVLSNSLESQHKSDKDSIEEDLAELQQSLPTLNTLTTIVQNINTQLALIDESASDSTSDLGSNDILDTDKSNLKKASTKPAVLYSQKNKSKTDSDDTNDLESSDDTNDLRSNDTLYDKNRQNSSQSSVSQNQPDSDDTESTQTPYDDATSDDINSDDTLNTDKSNLKKDRSKPILSSKSNRKIHVIDKALKAFKSLKFRKKKTSTQKTNSSKEIITSTHTKPSQDINADQEDTASIKEQNHKNQLHSEDNLN